MGHQQKAFTLIELIVVIVILGVLSVSVAPRFIDMTKDARIAALESAGSSILSGANLVYAKSVMQGVDKVYVGNVDINNDGVTDIQTIYGYPDSTRTNEIDKIVDLEDFTSVRTGFGTPTPALNYTLSSVTPSFTQVINSNCYLSYRRSTGIGIKPTVVYVTTGC